MTISTIRTNWDVCRGQKLCRSMETALQRIVAAVETPATASPNFQTRVTMGDTTGMSNTSHPCTSKPYINNSYCQQHSFHEVYTRGLALSRNCLCVPGVVLDLWPKGEEILGRAAASSPGTAAVPDSDRGDHAQNTTPAMDIEKR